MRKKRKERGRATREAADALAAQAGDGLEIVEGGDDEATGEPEADGDAEVEADAGAETGAEPEAELSAEGPSDADIDAELAALADSDEEPDAEAEPAEAVSSHPDPATLDAAQLKALIEALLFASDKPLTVQRLRQLTRVGDLPRVQAIVDEIQADFAARGVVLQEVSGGYLFRTHAAYSTWVQQLIQGRPVRLSRAQLETLAIVAYRQPITRPEIDQIRGVDSGATLKLLLDRSLIRILGKKEEPGRPLLYGSTKEFLDFFSLKDLRELPTLREYSELSEESRQMVERISGPASSTPGAGEPVVASDTVTMPSMEPDPDPIADDAQAKIDAAVAAADSLTDEIDPLGDRLS